MANVLRDGASTSYHEPAVSCDPAAFSLLVNSRRSVRKFLPDPIPKEIVRECLELALLAPNSSNLQTWSFHIVETEQARKQMDLACLSQPAAVTAPLLVVCTVDTNIWRRHAKEMLKLLSQSSDGAPKSVLEYYGRLVPIVYSAGPLGVFHFFKRLAVSVVGVFRPTPRQPTSHGDIRVWAHKSAALACENLMLALRANGYDSCPMEGLDSNRVLKILRLGRGHEVVMAISGGKRAQGGIYGPRLRFPSERFIKTV
jgi:nitroreductase